MPLLEEVQRMASGGASAGGSGAGAVLRSASDTAILTVAEAWELSLAAASASKDKRVKDVKNITLKQQNSKKKQTKTTAESGAMSTSSGQSF